MAALAVVLVLFGFDVIQYLTFVIKTPWQLDFSDFYFAARTGLTHGWAEMYNTSLSMPALYAATGNWFPFQHTPLFAWLLAPLSLLPYPVALTIWDGFLFGCFLLCWRLLTQGSAGRRLILLVAGLALYPVVLGLALGQPTLVVLAGVSLGWWLLRHDRTLLAAAALALIAVKPQSSFLVPIALLLAGASASSPPGRFSPSPSRACPYSPWGFKASMTGSTPSRSRTSSLGFDSIASAR